MKVLCLVIVNVNVIKYSICRRNVKNDTFVAIRCVFLFLLGISPDPVGGAYGGHDRRQLALNTLGGFQTVETGECVSCLLYTSPSPRD